MSIFTIIILIALSPLIISVGMIVFSVLVATVLGILSGTGGTSTPLSTEAVIALTVVYGLTAVIGYFCIRHGDKIAEFPFVMRDKVKAILKKASEK